MKIRLADENGGEILGVEGLVETIADFELKTGFFSRLYEINERWLEFDKKC